MNPNSINDSLAKLRGRRIVTRMARGDYRIEDRDFEVFLSGGSPLPSAAAALGEGDRPRPHTAYVGRIEVVDGDRVVQRINDGRIVAHSLASLYKLGGGLRAALWSAEPVSIRYADNTLGQVTMMGVQMIRARSRAPARQFDQEDHY